MSCSLSLCTLLILFSLVCHPPIPFVSSLSFNISSFDANGGDILLEGVARIVSGAVQLTDSNILQAYFQVGRIQYSKPIDIWDSVTGRQADFSTRFSFTIDTNNATKYSDGMAFFLAPVGFQIPPNSAGGFLGLFNDSTLNAGPQNQIVMVEFDTWSNSRFDPPGQHIGINSNSLSSLVHASWDAGSHSGNPTNVLVTYNSTSKNLSVFWSFDDKSVSPGDKSSFLSYQIDLAKVLPESVAIGFSASCGVSYESHSINSWEINSSLNVERPSPADTSNKGVSKLYRIITFITAPVACLLMVILAGSCLFMTTMRKKCEFRALTHIDKEIVALPLQFSYQELLVGTNGFANDRRLGQGGSGQVYKGFLNCLDRLVAVKRIFAESKHSEKVFTNEVKIISRTIHRNLVQFIGWCQEEGEFLLVYEYMPNGSLDNHLFGTRKSLSWDVRYKIALGLALALNYLHEELEQCVLHRDIKAANILLDTNFNTKLGDFGVAKLVDPQFRTQMTDVVGTRGYLAPEYASEGRATKESDMFSFGVVALEIVCGRRAYGEGEFQVPLYKWLWQLYLTGNMLEAADESLNSSFDGKEMECLMMVGLWCVHPDPKRRPKAGQVIRFLQLEVPVPEFPRGTYEAPTLYQQSALRIESSSSMQESLPVKQDTSWLLKPSSNTC
ncbi:L-type lectin-domain containing receptor kinase IX.1-like [Syzygium oleosum]|uniref:L-type lectin-domain containing receptor kinase IX.1-like n=1 Tax=Syzygium oleosum TaxID=219896 RepID=UPI0011D2B013|nr:L-type lectin-domain containing receptor kinase IX.1-like [Syzygium oleosum]